MAIRRLRRSNIESFLVNPRGKRVRRHTRKKRFFNFAKRLHKSRLKIRHKRRKNALGGTLMLVGNPTRRKRKGGVSMARRRRGRPRHNRALRLRRRNPVRHVVYSSPGRHRIRHRRSNPIRHIRRHSRRRRNPVVMGIDIGQIMVGALSAMATVAVPTWIKAQSSLTKYGSQAATAIAGKFVMEKLFKSAYGNTWMVVGLSMMAADVLREYVLQKVTLLTAAGPISIPTGTPAKVEGGAAAVAAGGAGVSGYLDRLSGLGAYLNDMPENYAFGSMFGA